MVSNKRTRGLDQSTRNTLSALEAALMASQPKDIRADEFTADQYIMAQIAKGDKRSYEALRNALRHMQKAGKFKSRKVVVNGKECNAYSIAPTRQ